MEKEKLFNRLKEYMELEAMSRYEEPVVEALRKNISKGFVSSRDGLGSLILKHEKSKSNSPRIMVAAHMDEVGYTLREVETNGQVRLSAVGGIWPTVVIGTKAKLYVNATGKTYDGVFGHTSIHIMDPAKFKEAIQTNDLYADFGFESKEKAEQLQVSAGDRVYLSGQTIRLHDPNLVGGKAMDNRAGVTVLDYIAQHIQNVDLPNETFLVGTVQEEVGLRGAKASVGIVEPDIAIALDTCASHDTLGAKQGIQKLGNGAALRIQDQGTMMDPKLVEFIFALAKKHNIPAYKYVAQGGGTDAGELQFGKKGVATITISIPQRYLHSPIGVASLVDLKACGDLIVEFLKSFDKEAFEKMKYK
ncbi:zinc-binding metallopeptidase family protein [Mycoplasmopsis pulmonis]|nr:M42 family metallopeptidase [Mycoplasmopsis pulmonis]MDZ7293418.1 M42 family metallopeptidase [Mycoplasmopsis pulmonis]VEU68496.1 Putative aminopeptidase ysdC [Mycoplasmopsis pulmonis]